MSIQSTTAPSEGSSLSEEPFPKRARAKLETIDEDKGEDDDVRARASSVDITPRTPLPAREEITVRRRSRSPVPPVQRAALETAQ